jgi:alpha-ketoglutarate-dependent 2,4-dichlorophenoxyacetate dioxygenase
MAPRVATMRSGFLAAVGGVDLAGPVTSANMATLWQASDAHAVLVFRGQTLSDAQQIAFAENFGQPERYVLSYRRNAALRLGRPEMVDVSNLDAAAGRAARRRRDRVRRYLRRV